MSGHSKWHKVKHQKALKDPRKSKEFARLSKQIQIAAREGDSDPDKNPTLRKAVEAAKAANIPKDNIQRAIEKGSGINKTGDFESFTLEGYGSGGVAILLELQTDNRNRTVSEIRAILKKKDGSLGEPGSAAYVFGTDPSDPQFKTPISNPALKNLFRGLLADLLDHPDVVQTYHNLQD